VLLVGADRYEYQLDPGQQIPGFRGGEIGQQERFLGERAGRVGYHLFSYVHLAARCSGGYESRLAYPSRLAPEASDRMTDAGLELPQRLFSPVSAR
jgi:hypothetical protein